MTRGHAKGVTYVQKVEMALGCTLLLEERYPVWAPAESVTTDHKIAYAHSQEVCSKIEDNLMYIFVQSVHYLCAFFWERKHTYMDQIDRLFKYTLVMDLNCFF